MVPTTENWMLSAREIEPREKQSRFRFHQKYKLNPNDNHLDSDFIQILVGVIRFGV